MVLFLLIMSLWKPFSMFELLLLDIWANSAFASTCLRWKGHYRTRKRQTDTFLHSIKSICSPQSKNEQKERFHKEYKANNTPLQAIKPLCSRQSNTPPKESFKRQCKAKTFTLPHKAELDCSAQSNNSLKEKVILQLKSRSRYQRESPFR